MSSHHVPLSICIPSYNSERFISETIRSVLTQTRQDFELVIVDDCSSDMTYEIIASHDDPRIRLFRNLGNIGAEGNWNKCLELARGRYIKILPGDDTLYPTCLERQAKILDDPGNAQVALTYCSRDVVDANGAFVMKARFSRTGKVGRREMVRKNVRHGMNVIGEPGAVLFRAEAAGKAGRFDAGLPYIIDLNYWLRLLEHGDAYAISEPLCTFRLTNANWSVVLGKSRRDNYLHFIDRLRNDRANGVTIVDALVGKGRAYLNELLRSLIYTYVRKRTDAVIR